MPFVFAGRLVEPAPHSECGTPLKLPPLDLDALVLPRQEMPPLLDVRLDGIVAFLVETGKRLDFAGNRLMQQAAEAIARVNPLPHRVIDNIYAEILSYFTAEAPRLDVQAALGHADVRDGWRRVIDPTGRGVGVRALLGAP